MSVANLMLPRQTVVLLRENKIKPPILIQSQSGWQFNTQQLSGG
jgi:hypothetical protein